MTDWSLIGGTDPAPGDPEQLRFRLRHVDQTAANMRELSIELSRIAQGSEEADWRGEAADAMRDVLDRFRHDLHPIANSFENLSGALGRYATTVDDLQQQARQALARAKVAEQRRQAAESQRSAAAANLAAQRRSLLARHAEQTTHRAVTMVTLDPAVQATEAAQGDWLARQTAQAERAVQETSGQVQRFEATIDGAESDLSRERTNARTIREEWERASNTAKVGVEGALSEQLLNLSHLEKAWQKALEGLDAIGRFLADPIPYIAELRKVIEKLQAFVSKAALFVAMAAKIAGLLSFIPGMAAVAAALAGLATILTVVALTLAAAKLLTGLMLWGSGRSEVGTGDLAVDVIDLGFSAAPFLGGNAKVLKPMVGSKQWHGQQKQIHDSIRRSAILRWGGPTDVTKEALRMTGGVAVDETKKAVKGEMKKELKAQIRTRLNEMPRNDARVPVPAFSGARAGGGGW